MMAFGVFDRMVRNAWIGLAMLPLIVAACTGEPQHVPTSAVKPCRGDQLFAKEIVTDGAAGNVWTPVEVVNRSSESCRLSGYPNVRFLDAAGEDLRLAATASPTYTGAVPPSPIPRAPFVLDPQDKAWFVVYFSDEQPPCTRVFGVRITPPGGTGWVTMHVSSVHEWDVCQGSLTYTAATITRPGS
jgi:hypothetical protein